MEASLEISRTRQNAPPALSVQGILPQASSALIPVHLQRGDEGFLRDIDLSE
jgi:hypothetical protein